MCIGQLCTLPAPFSLLPFLRGEENGVIFKFQKKRKKQLIRETVVGSKIQIQSEETKAYLDRDLSCSSFSSSSPSLLTATRSVELIAPFLVAHLRFQAEEEDGSDSRSLLPTEERDLEKMADIQLGAHTVRSHGTKVLRFHMHDWLILVLLGVIDIILNVIDPFHRFVGKDMMTDLKYPFKGNTIPFWAVPIFGILLPFVIFFGIYFKKRNVYDLHQAILGILFSVLITAVLTDAIKDAVGRPRPDFFWRCFPDGIGVYDNVTSDVICNGKKSDIKEGHKSFPSGHSSWSFAGLGFLSWYLAGKIRAFDRRGHVAKLCIVFLPLLCAALVAISRVDDYWHHWQDVFAGGILGLVVASFCYLQFFPPPCDVDGWGPHAYFSMLADTGSEVPPTTTNHLALNSRTVEMETVSVRPEHHYQVNMRDSSPILDDMESGGGRY